MSQRSISLHKLDVTIAQPCTFAFRPSLPIVQLSSREVKKAVEELHILFQEGG